MDNLFDKETSQKFISRIHKLTPESATQWGKMNVGQMLAHCQAPLKIASGEIKPKVNSIIKFLFGKSAKKQMVSPQPFQRNLPTLAEAKITDERVFDQEKQKLIDLIDKFQKLGPAGLIKDPHPFFGPLTMEEWNTMQVKHLNHHLSQFGV